jgi:sec-independent protein translocase protein TatA
MEPDMHTLAFLQNIGPMEWVIIMVIALLLFGRRLPEVGRSLGKGIVEFKKGLKDLDSDVEAAANRPATAPAATSAHATTLPPPAPSVVPPVQAEQRVSRSDVP